MSLLLDALYKASKDKEKAAELALVPRQEEVQVTSEIALAPPEPPAVPALSTTFPQEFQLELPKPFESLPEPATPVVTPVTPETPYPSLELELEPRVEDYKKEVAQELAIEVVTSPEPVPIPKIQPQSIQQDTDLPAMAAEEPVQVQVPTESAQISPDPVPEGAKPTRPNPVKPTVSEAIKQPGKIAQILSRSTKTTSGTMPQNKRMLVLGGLAVTMLMTMGMLFWYEGHLSAVQTPVAAVVLQPVHIEEAQPAVPEEVVQMVDSAISTPRLVAVETNSGQNKRPQKSETTTTQVAQQESTPSMNIPMEGVVLPQPAGAKTRQGLITATVKPNHLANAYAALVDGRLEEASQSYAKVLQTNSYEPNALLGLATIAHQRGQREEALEYYQRVLRQDPVNVTATAAMLELDTKLDASAASLKARELVERQPDSVAALTAAANALVRDGMVAETTPLFARAHRLEPENPLHVYNHAVALDRLGQTAEAIELYKKVVKMSENQLPSAVRPFSLEVVKLRLADLSQSSIDNLK